MSVIYQQAAPIATAGGQSFVMPDMFASPGLTMIAPQQQSVVYAAPTQTVNYAQPTQFTYAAAEPQYTYGAPVEMTYAAPAMTYASPAEMTYAAPQPYEYAAAPVGGQPVYTISPERFQLIMQGQPLTNEEIAAMTGAPQTAAPVMTQAVGAQSFVMPDMFSSPGLTMVGGAPGSQVMTQTSGAQSFVMPDMFASPGLTMVGGNPGEFNTGPATTTAVAQPVPAALPATSSPKKSSSKKSDKKKKVSSKKKSKGCC